MRRGGIAAAMAVALVVAGCGEGETGGAGNGDGPTRAADRGGTDAGGTDVREWVAVFETVQDPNDLDAASADLRKKVKGSILVEPAGCHEGLPEELSVDANAYVLGVVAASQEKLEEAVRKADREPISRGSFRPLCGV